jgi:hypothetical protein
MLDKLKGWLVAAGAALAAILWAFYKGKKEGKDEEQASQAKSALSTVSRGNMAGNRAAVADDDALRLRDRHNRNRQ